MTASRLPEDCFRVALWTESILSGSWSSIRAFVREIIVNRVSYVETAMMCLNAGACNYYLLRKFCNVCKEVMSYIPTHEGARAQKNPSTLVHATDGLPVRDRWRTSSFTECLKKVLCMKHIIETRNQIQFYLRTGYRLSFTPQVFEQIFAQL